MSEFGWILVFVGAVVGLAGLLIRRKIAKVNAVPFRAPSEIARMGGAAADAKGLVSTEGAVSTPQPLLAPMSGQPCLAFEITIERKWEREEQDGKGGVSTRSGTDVAYKKYEGSMFHIADQSGAVWIDASSQPDVSLERSHSSTERVGLIVPQAIAFGAMQFQTPMLPKDSRTVAFVGTEKILRPAGTMYALGALEVSPQGAKIGTPKGILSGSLMLSLQGRSELLRKGQRNMKLAFGFAAAFTVAGIPMGIFGPSAASGASQPASAAATATTPASAAAIPASAGANPGVRTLALGATEHGRLAATDPNAAPSTDERGDDYTVQLTAGQPVTIFTRGAVDPTSESHLDVVAALRCNGAEVARDDDGAGNLDSRIAYTPTASGPCTVRVMGFAGSGGAYSVQLLPGTVEATPEAVAVAPAVPAAAPSAPTAAAGSTCARAVRCCQAANPTDGSARATCERLALLPDTACTSTLQSYRRAVRAAHPASASACD